jgi:hypothetical protein
VRALRRDAPGWTADFRNGFPVGAGDAKGTVYAICYNMTLPALITTDHQVQSGTGQNKDHTAQTMTGCQSGMTLTAGGFARTVYDSFPTTNSPNPTGTAWNELFIEVAAPVAVGGLAAIIDCVSFPGFSKPAK